jgi:hypothetical protein
MEGINMNKESVINGEKKKIDNNICGTNNLKNYIKSLGNQGKGLLMNGAIQVITSFRANGMMFEKNFKEEYPKILKNIMKELDGKSIDFSICVLSGIIMIILELAVKKEISGLTSQKEDIANNLLGYI